MRVLHTTTTFPQSEDFYWGTSIFQLCEALADEGVEIEMLAPNTPDSEPIDTNFELNRYDYFFGKEHQTLVAPPGIMPNLQNKPWRAVQGPFFYRSLTKKIRERSEDADIVHAHWLIPAGFMAVRNTDLPTIATVRGAEYHLDPNGFLARLVRHTQGRIDRMVAVSHYLRERGIEVFDAPADTFSVVQNAVDCDKFRPGIDTDIRDEFGIPEEHRLVSTARRLVPEKRVVDMVEAAELVLEEEDDVTFVIAGDGPQREALEKAVRKNGMADSFVFTGFIPHHRIPELLSESAISVVTTEQEGLANALLEAMASEAVVVATDAVGNDEVVADGEDGVLYEPGNVDALSSRIRELLDDDSRRRKIAANARRKMEEEFSYPAAAEKYAEIYKEIL